MVMKQRGEETKAHPIHYTVKFNQFLTLDSKQDGADILCKELHPTKDSGRTYLQLSLLKNTFDLISN